MGREASLPHLQVSTTCPFPALDQPSPCPTPHPTSWRFTLILFSHLFLGLPSGLLPQVSPLKNHVYTSPFPHTYYMLRPSLLDLITRIILGEKYISLSSSLSCFLHSPVTSSLLGLNIFLSTLFSNMLGIRSSLNVSENVSHPHKTSGKIIVLCILIFILLGHKLEDERFCTEW